MKIEIPDDNSIVKWKKNDNDEWESAEISDLIKAYEKRPQGDLISREALKEAVKNRFDNSEYFPFHFLALIDNAQPVEINEQTIKDAYEQGYADGWKERYGEPDGRPKGEWVEKIYENDDEERTKSKSFVCSCCGANRVAGLGNAKFCYNCGADMRKGGME